MVGLKELVSKSTLNRWIKKFDLAKLICLLTKTVAYKKPSLMAIDATGFDSFNRSRHYEDCKILVLITLKCPSLKQIC